MYKQITTPAIIIKRVNYSESDRIITFLTPVGKISAMVKGVRRQGSKLAGGIELFSVAQITTLDTRGDLGRVIQSRLITYFDKIVTDLPRMMYAYECLKSIAKITPELTEDDGYFLATQEMLKSINNFKISIDLIDIWWCIQLLKLNGQELNLQTDNQDQPLTPKIRYRFGLEHPILIPDASGAVGELEIKFLRLCNSSNPAQINRIKNLHALIKTLTPEIRSLTGLDT